MPPHVPSRNGLPSQDARLLCAGSFGVVPVPGRGTFMLSGSLSDPNRDADLSQSGGSRGSAILRTSQAVAKN